MPESQFLPLLLFLHVLGAILGVRADVRVLDHGRDGRRASRSTRNFSARQTEAIGDRLVYPLAIFHGDHRRRC